MAAPAAALTNPQDLLPACQRCRRLRRRCDTQLPACRRCTAAKQDCTFIDPAYGETVRRGYVQSLVMRLAYLSEAEYSHRGGQARNAPALTASGGTQLNPDHRLQHHCDADTDADERHQNLRTDGTTAAHSFSAIISPIHAIAGETRYWGASSVVVLVVEVFDAASVAGFLDIANNLSHSANVENTIEALWQVDEPTTTRLTSEEITRVQKLLGQYLSSTNTLYGIVDPIDARIWLSDYVNLLNSPDFDAANLNAEQSWLCFCVNMMCAIACAAQSRHYLPQATESLRYYNRAILHIEDSTSTISFPSLQALVLLIVFCLFQPAKGDVWKLLDHACHLAIELCYHRETEQTVLYNGGSKSLGSSVPSLPLRRTFFWSLYAIEVTASQLYGRHSTLPEFIISTQYPDETVSQQDHGVVSLQASEPVPDMEPASYSLRLAGCYGRLMTIRSEIFRTVYASENKTPDSTIHEVLRGQYDRLLAWQQEYKTFAGQDMNETILSLACEIGYDATVCSIFQVHIMRLLRMTRGALTNKQHQDPVENSSATLSLGESYDAATRLLRAYERILDSTEGSTRGAYPITFIDSNYMFMAAAILIANGLLALRDDIKTLKDPALAYENNTASGRIDWHAFIGMSVTCPRLLTWCTERWPPMKGMLKPYKNLFIGLLRELIIKGFIS